MMESLRRRCRWVDPAWLPTPARGLLDHLPDGYAELLVDPLELLRSPAPESMIAPDDPAAPHVATRWSALRADDAASVAGTRRPADIAATNTSPAGSEPSGGRTIRTAQPPLPSLPRLPLGAINGPAPLREARYADVAPFPFERVPRRGEPTPLHPLAPNAPASDPTVVRSSPRDLVRAVAAAPAAPGPILPEGSAADTTAARTVIAPAHRLAQATGLATPPRESDPSPVRLTRSSGQLASVLANNLDPRHGGSDSNGDVERPVQALRPPARAHLREPALSMRTALEPAPAEDIDRPLAAGPIQADSRSDVHVITPELVEALMEALADELQFEFLRTYGTVR